MRLSAFLFIHLRARCGRGKVALRRLQRRCSHFYEALRKRMKSDVKVIVKFDSKREC